MMAALAVFGLVIDDAADDFDLAGAEVALEIRGVVLRVPEAELDAGKYGKPGRTAAAVGDPEFPDLKRFTQRHEVGGLRLDLAIAGADDRVTQAMAALVAIQLAARGLPRWRPEFTVGAVAEIQVTPAIIERGVVVAIARQPAQPGVAIERIAAGCVGDNPEIGFAAQVIDPRQWVLGRVITYSRWRSLKCP